MAPPIAWLGSILGFVVVYDVCGRCRDASAPTACSKDNHNIPQGAVSPHGFALLPLNPS